MMPLPHAKSAPTDSYSAYTTQPQHARTSRNIRRPLWGTSLLASLLLTGCAYMSPEECTRADWFALGYDDGAKGRNQERLQWRIEACTEANIAADTRRYTQGYNQGLQKYCQLDNAFTLGAKGSHYAGVCPPSIEPEFRRHYEQGRAIYDAQKEIQRLQGLIEGKERELKHTYDEERQRLHTQKREDERRRIQRDFEQRRKRLRADIEELDRKLHRARDAQHHAERIRR